MTIKELREKYNLTQSALARSLGVSSNAISGIEAGRIKLSPKMSARIKEVYGEEVATSPAPEKKAVAPVETTVVEKKATPKKLAEAEAAPALEKKDDVESAVDEKAAEVATPAAPAPEKKPEKKTTAKKIADKAAESVVVEVATTDVPAKEKKAAPKKAAPKKTAAPAAPASEKKPAKKATLKKAAPKKSAETVTAEAAAPGAPAKEKKVEKKPAPKKIAAPEKNAAAKKTPPTVILQSPFGGEITVDAVKTLVGEVDKIYVRIDQNKLYWVKGKETGNKDIW